MNALIIEDEQFAADRLEQLIGNCDSSIRVVGKTESIADSVEWLKNNPRPDLIFLDIHLEDGLSFSIFDQVKVDAPIIFTTAFDEYAIKAFKLRSIDYLLKPINADDLSKAITKFKEWKGEERQLVDLKDLYLLMQQKAQSYRERFSVSVGERLKSVHVNEVAYFFSTSGITFMVLLAKNQYSVELSLDKLKEELDPGRFFRINRQYLITHDAIANVFVYPKSRLRIELKPPVQDDVFVSLDRVTEFKHWLDGGKT